MSGLVAYEVARLLEAEGESVERLVLVNASPMLARRVSLIDAVLRRIASNAALAPKLRDTLCYNLARFHAALVLGPGALLKLARYALDEPPAPAAGGAHADRRRPRTLRETARGARDGELFRPHRRRLLVHPKKYGGEVTLVWAEDQDTVEDDPTAGWGPSPPACGSFAWAEATSRGSTSASPSLASATEEALHG